MKSCCPGLKLHEESKFLQSLKGKHQLPVEQPYIAYNHVYHTIQTKLAFVLCDLHDKVNAMIVVYDE